MSLGGILDAKDPDAVAAARPVHPVRGYLLALVLIGAISVYGAFCGRTRTPGELACLEAVRMTIRAHEALALDPENADARERLIVGESRASRDCEP
jgi:hypothetical protein